MLARMQACFRKVRRVCFAVVMWQCLLNEAEKYLCMFVVGCGCLLFFVFCLLFVVCGFVASVVTMCVPGVDRVRRRACEGGVTGGARFVFCWLRVYLFTRGFSGAARTQRIQYRMLGPSGRTIRHGLQAGAAPPTLRLVCHCKMSQIPSSAWREGGGCKA